MQTEPGTVMTCCIRHTGHVLVSLLAVSLFSLALVGQESSNENEEEIEQIRSELASITLSVDFHETRFLRIIDGIRKQVSFNIIVDRQVRQRLSEDPNRNASKDTGGRPEDRNREVNSSPSDAKGGSNGETMDNRVTLELQDVTLKKVFKLVLAQKHLTAVYHHGSVFIVPEQQGRDVHIRTYDVRDLQYNVPDFEPKIERKDLIDVYRGEDEERGSGPSVSQPSDDTDSSGAYGSDRYGSSEDSDSKQTPSNPDADEEDGRFTEDQRIAELIRENLGSHEDWHGKPSIRVMEGRLVVNQTPEMHRRIMVFLNRMRQMK